MEGDVDAAKAWVEGLKNKVHALTNDQVSIPLCLNMQKSTLLILVIPQQVTIEGSSLEEYPEVLESSTTVHFKVRHVQSGEYLLVQICPTGNGWLCIDPRDEEYEEEEQ